MNSPLSRRALIASSAASLAVAAAMSSSAAAAEAAPTRLLVERRTIEVDGRAASVFGIRQPDGTPGIVLDPGHPFSVTVANRASEATIIHWHGQAPPFLQDGVFETGGLLIQPGAVQAYDFPARPGTHWMHSHHGLQEQALMAAPLIVRTALDMKEDVQDVTVLLHDFSFRDPAEVLAAVTGAGKAAPGGATMPGMAMAPAAGTPDLNDYDYDAYLANDRTLGDPLVIRAAPGGRVRLRLINGATWPQELKQPETLIRRFFTAASRDALFTARRWRSSPARPREEAMPSLQVSVPGHAVTSTMVPAPGAARPMAFRSL